MYSKLVVKLVVTESKTVKFCQEVDEEGKKLFVSLQIVFGIKLSRNRVLKLVNIVSCFYLDHNFLLH